MSEPNGIPDNWKQIWVDTLRSGRYRQACGAFARPDGSGCAIGVLGMELVRLGYFTNHHHAIDQVIGTWPTLVNMVVDLNDWRGRSFPEIAAVLEQHFGLPPTVTVLVGEPILPADSRAEKDLVTA